MDETLQTALEVLKDQRVAVFIVAYNAEKHIESVLKRIPEPIAENLAEIYIIDDHSSDHTKQVAEETDWPNHFAPLKIYRTPWNQGYGGNQKLGYLYAIKNKIDIVLLLHGDGQYAPEALPHIIAGYKDPEVDAVFGSRFLSAGGARKGGMPLYKWVGNRILTWMQNRLLGSKMSEMHSGYRSYRTRALSNVPFPCNSSWFDFDADIIIQMHAAGYRILELPIPTYYGEEICHVNGMRYAWLCIKAAIKYRLMQVELFYDPKFDLGYQEHSSERYTAKSSPYSIHSFIRNIEAKDNSAVLDVGGGRGNAVAKALAERGFAVTGVDQDPDLSDTTTKQYQVDLDKPWAEQFPAEQYDIALALDIIEHLHSPESAANQLFASLKSSGRLYASTANVAYWPVRLMLFLGAFNYGRRGILDFTHRRLFTTPSFRRLLQNAGFVIRLERGFAPPLSDLSGKSSVLLTAIDSVGNWLARIWPGLFAYQILMVCERPDSTDDLMKQMFEEPA